MKKYVDTIMELLDSVVVGLVAVMVIFTLFGRIYVVDGDSMLSTLHEEDRLLVSQFLYTPKQGDIVCFVEETKHNKVLVKRVIATAGQTIDIDKTGSVIVDGAQLDEPYLDAGIYTSPKAFSFPYTVKEGEVFCMGDNRVNSSDSRDFGPVSTHQLLGRMLIRLFPNTGVVK